MTEKVTPLQTVELALDIIKDSITGISSSYIEEKMWLRFEPELWGDGEEQDRVVSSVEKSVKTIGDALVRKLDKMVPALRAYSALVEVLKGVAGGSAPSVEETAVAVQ